MLFFREPPRIFFFILFFFLIINQVTVPLESGIQDLQTQWPMRCLEVNGICYWHPLTAWLLHLHHRVTTSCLTCLLLHWCPDTRWGGWAAGRWTPWSWPVPPGWSRPSAPRTEQELTSGAWTGETTWLNAPQLLRLQYHSQGYTKRKHVKRVVVPHLQQQQQAQPS